MDRKIRYFYVKIPELRGFYKAFSIEDVMEKLNIKDRDKIREYKTACKKYKQDLTGGYKNKKKEQKNFYSRQRITFIPISISCKKVNKKCEYLRSKTFNQVTLYRCVNPKIIEQARKIPEDSRILKSCCGIFYKNT